MSLENIAKNLKRKLAILGLAGALTLGAVGTAQAQDVGKIFFEANYWEDIYGDNSVHYPEGYHGIKHDFKDNEEIIFIGHDPGWSRGDDIEYVLYGPKGDVMLKEDINLEYDGEWYHAGESIDEDLMYDMMNSSKGGYGNYKVVWYENGHYDGQSEFSVFSSK